MSLKRKSCSDISYISYFTFFLLTVSHNKVIIVIGKYNKFIGGFKNGLFQCVGEDVHQF